MTIDDFDKKIDLRKRICKLDAILDRFDELNKDGNRRYQGVGVVWTGAVFNELFSDRTDDEYIVQKFKDAVRERRAELIKEFEND